MPSRLHVTYVHAWVCQLQLWVWCCIPVAVQDHPSCSAADVTGLFQAQQQCMRQLAAQVLRMNVSLQKAPCQVGKQVLVSLSGC